MSDGVQVALITGVFAFVTPLSVAIFNHLLGKRDRDLASETMRAKNREIRMERSRRQRAEAELRRCRLRRSRPRKYP